MVTLTTTIALLAVFAIFCIFPHGEAFAPNDAKVSRTLTFEVTSFVPRSSFYSPTALSMGLFDSFLSRFGDKDNEGDFVKLEQIMNEQFVGPGPVVLLYKMPDGIDDDEVRDILEDGAPGATKRGISIARIPNMEATATATATNSKSSDAAAAAAPPGVSLVDLSLQEALETVLKNPPPKTTLPPSPAGAFEPVMRGISSGSPVVIFSGFSNTEMMESYNILGSQVYQETAASNGTGDYMACATAVPNAMNKPLRQVLEEISGDHAEAMASSSSSSQEDAA